MGFAESLARAALEPNAGLGLFEEGTPALGSAVAAELLHGMANWARCLGAATAEAQQWQILCVLHECQVAILGAMLMCAGLAISHRTFECAKSGAKLGCANMGCVRGVLFSRRAFGWQGAVLLSLLLSVPIAAAASLPLEGPDAGRVASEPSNSFSADFTYVTPGTFDRPLELLGAPDGQHGRALRECVRTALSQEPCHPHPHFNAPMKLTSVLDSHLVDIVWRFSTTDCTCSDTPTLPGPLQRP